MKRSLSDYLLITVKGIAMGAADIVPGVSGGTIAFISGIYEELLETINSVNLNTLKILKKEGFSACWKSINGNFIIALLGGIFISVLSLANLVSYLLKTHPILIWAFFFGLVVASFILVVKQVKSWSVARFVALFIGIIIAYLITILPPMGESSELWFIFISGMIAICAMILPGISGSFILLLLGSYGYVLGAVKDFNLKVLIVFIMGCISGLLSFSRLLNYMFKHFHDITVALLSGFLIGSLNKVWPWKEVLSYRINSHGEKVPFMDKSILPSAYDGDPQVLFATACLLIGFSLIFIIDRIAARKSKA